MDAELHNAVKEYAAGFPVPILLAMIMAESQGNPNYTRLSLNLPHMWNFNLAVPFRTLMEHERGSVSAPDDFPGSDNEWLGQKTAWGPLPILGATAREQGYTGLFPALCGPQGIILACSRLNRLRDEYRLTIRETLLTWYSSDPVLADTVFSHVKQAENGHLLDT